MVLSQYSEKNYKMDVFSVKNILYLHRKENGRVVECGSLETVEVTPPGSNPLSPLNSPEIPVFLALLVA